MKVQRYINGFAEQQTIRVLQTTCPLCHKFVQFAMQDSDFVAEETETLEQENEMLRQSLARQQRIINNLSLALELRYGR
jgi:hypothetical protein